MENYLVNYNTDFSDVIYLRTYTDNVLCGKGKLFVKEWHR